MDFATKLRLMRIARGWTQQELGDRCGIPNNLISQMETGKLIPAGDWEISIKGTLGWPLDEGIFTVLATSAQVPA